MIGRLARPLGIGIALAALLATALGGSGVARAAASDAQFDAGDRLSFPTDFRRWIFLTSGIDMSYVEGPAALDTSMFDNVFVNPTAYDGFLKTGVWPDGTVLVLEHRAAQQKGSINKRGHFQTGESDIEVHVKDSQRFKGGWGFYAFDGKTPATMIPTGASCYSCHAAHGAVDTTFVQFYPTLQPTAAAKGTWSAAYLAERKADGK